MIEFLSEFKPFLSAIFLSPTIFFIFILLGIFLNIRYIILSRIFILFIIVIFWIFSSPIFTFWAFRNLLDHYSEVTADDLVANGIQVIVVLGGGVDVGKSITFQQLKPTALDRLRYGIELSRKTNIPLLVSGGKGWGAIEGSENEADLSQRVAKDVFNFNIKFIESQSRDTSENAFYSYKILSELNLTKIALVTHNWHMPRSMKNFKKVGFNVYAAPMGYINEYNNLIRFLPNNNALSLNFIIIKEYFGSKLII